MTAPPESVGVAVWGVGGHARKTVLPSLRDCAATRIVGLCTRDPSVLADQSGVYDCAGWTDPIEMFADPAVEAVYLATPSGLHAAHGGRVLATGRHLWCEKPLATSFSEAESLIALARPSGLAVTTSVAPLYHAQFRAMTEIVQSGELGAIEKISAVFHFPHVDPENFRYDRGLGGGALLDMAIYLLFLPSVLMGAAPRELSCETFEESPYEVDVAGGARTVFDGGAEADVSWGYGRDYENWLRIEGTTGTLHAEPAFSKPPGLAVGLTLSNGAGDREIAVEETDQFVALIEDSVSALNEPKLREAFYERALATQRLIEFAKESARLGGEPIAIETSFPCR